MTSLRGMDVPLSRVVYRFSGFELDAVAYELTRDGARIRLARQPMELLLLLVQRAGELVSRDEIARHLWPGDVFVEVDAGIQAAVLKIRQALGDRNREASLIVTVPGKGYRFSAAVQVVAHDERRRQGRESMTSTLGARRHNLPAELTTFVGRRNQIEQLLRLLTTTRLLTLTGSGGVGKTRLAVRLAQSAMANVAAGAWMVDLGTLSRPDLIPETIAEVLGLREDANRSARETVRDFLASREVLLVLDTCEHMVADCAALAEALLHESPGLHIIATSREALSVAGEVVYRVPSLSIPELDQTAAAVLDAEAVRLFVDRASALDMTFRVDPASAEAIARICRRLDGIPLAIELAAARIPVLTPAQIEERLQDRFRLLTGNTRTAVARQRTLEATLDWSYHLLSDRERAVLCRLSVFPASWTIDAAESICDEDEDHAGEMLDLLARLVSKSLVAIDGDGGRERRYRLLETVRQYASERLVQTGAADRVRDRHFAFFRDTFRDAGRTLLGPDQVAWLRRLQMEQENIRAALDWSLSSPTLCGAGAEFVAALIWLWTKRALFREGRLWLERAATIDAPPATRAWLLIGLSRIDYFQGCLTAAEQDSTDALTLAGAEGDPWVLMFAHMMQGHVRFKYGDYDRAAALALQACEDVHLRLSGPLMIMGNVARVRGDHEQAQVLYDEAVESCRRAGDAWALGIVALPAAGLRILSGQFDDAEVVLAEALSSCRSLDDTRGVAWCVAVFGALEAARGHAETACRLWGAADGLLDGLGGSLNPEVGWIRDQYVTRTRSAMGDRRFAAIFEHGRHLSLDQAVGLIEGARTDTLVRARDGDAEPPSPIRE